MSIAHFVLCLILQVTALAPFHYDAEVPILVHKSIVVRHHEGVPEFLQQLHLMRTDEAAS